MSFELIDNFYKICFVKHTDENFDTLTFRHIQIHQIHTRLFCLSCNETFSITFRYFKIENKYRLMILPYPFQTDSMSFTFIKILYSFYSTFRLVLVLRWPFSWLLLLHIMFRGFLKLPGKQLDMKRVVWILLLTWFLVITLRAIDQHQCD